MNFPVDAQDVFCSELSIQTDESMAGTASRVESWLLLEYNGPWTARATEDNDLPLPVKRWLSGQLAATGNSRLQFIKQQRPAGSTGVVFVVAITSETAPRLYEFRLQDYGDLQDLDMAAIVSGDSAYAGKLHTGPLYLVCTNGRRDRCCSRYGLGLYQALEEQVGQAAWQSTHLGGHRFAPTVVTFPDGAYYGRLSGPDLPAFIEAQKSGELHLSHLRGRCCYDEAIQAAEYYLRRKSGLRKRAEVFLVDSNRVNDESWVVTFELPAKREIHRVQLRKEGTAREHVVSCTPLKVELIDAFIILSHDKING